MLSMLAAARLQFSVAPQGFHDCLLVLELFLFLPFSSLQSVDRLWFVHDSLLAERIGLPANSLPICCGYCEASSNYECT